MSEEELKRVSVFIQEMNDNVVPKLKDIIGSIDRKGPKPSTPDIRELLVAIVGAVEKGSAK